MIDAVRPLAAVTTAALLAAGCAHAPWRVELPVPSSSATTARVEPPPPSTVTTVEVPQELLRPGAAFSLAEVVDIALRSSPLTRASYERARAAAFAARGELSPYYPRLDAGAYWSRADVGGPGRDAAPVTAYGPQLSLAWLLLDAGGRSADAEVARLALLIEDFRHDATVRDVVLAVQEAYFAYLNARAQMAAAETVVTQSATALEAANGRHDAGVATIAEVLLARTALSQAELDRQRAAGEMMVLRGALATAIGVPATIGIDVGELPGEVPLAEAERAIEPLLEAARAGRPELSALRIEADRAGARITSAQSDRLPAVTLSASAAPTWYEQGGTTSHTDWAARMLVSVPLFTGFDLVSRVDEARAQASAAAAEAASLEQQVVFEVWRSYHALRTSTQQVLTSRDLLASATEAEQVALGRYREGVGTILDLLVAQSALARARAEEIQARANWYTAASRLTRDAALSEPLFDIRLTTEETTVP